MVKAVWNGTVIAESTETEIVEGNHYFPADSIHAGFFRKSAHTTVCGWKGTASYYDVIVNGQTNPSAAWYYAEPRQEAQNIRGRIAFWKGVKIEA
jgi:uncharacterized protein (DUF427 family)